MVLKRDALDSGVGLRSEGVELGLDCAPRQASSLRVLRELLWFIIPGKSTRVCSNPGGQAGGTRRPHRAWDQPGCVGSRTQTGVRKEPG